MTFTLRALRPDDITACSALLADLPEWFGRPEVNAAYADGLRTAPAFVVTDGNRQLAGFAGLRAHDPGSMEIEVMAVRRELHRLGIGRRLIGEAIDQARRSGANWLHVKTRGPSTFDDDYEKTRRFYRSVGFEPLYESRTEWGPDDAALVLVMSLQRESQKEPMDDDPPTSKSALVADAATRAQTYLRTHGPVFPGESAIDGLDGLTSVLPAEPTEAASVIEQLDRLGSPATVRNTVGRYFGFVTGGTEPEALAASVLVSTWDQNIALPVMSPVAARVDDIASRWVVELLGLPSASQGGFCGGAAVANLTCVLAARDALLARAGWDVDADGLVGAPPLHIVASAEIHVAVRKALRVAGLGQADTVLVPTDECGRVRVDEMPPLGPRSLVLLQAGNVNTGHSDPFGPIAEMTEVAGGWLHVDGAFGLWAAAAPEYRHLVAGVEAADSWALDAHKWLNVSYDSAIAICARGEDLRRAMAIDAAYLPNDAGRASMHLGLQMSQRARAVETWAVIATKGRSGIADMVGGSCRLAARMAEQLDEAGATILAPVVLNQILVAFGDDSITAAVIDAVQRDGTCWAGGTRWKGRTAMRISVSDTSSTEADADAAVDAILRCRAALPG
jgi:glutamate/tyrosine decarboxylase-like PLP-dependent enzyme/GNAT superfamily N-acetyltransferase